MLNKEKNTMKHTLKLMALGVSLIGLSACSNNEQTFSSMEWKTTAQKFSQFECLRFHKGETHVSAHNNKLLHDLMVKADKNTHTYAVIALSVPAVHGKTGVHEARTNAIIKVLMAHSIPLHRIDVVYKNTACLAAQKASDRDVITVTINQYVLQAPDCPGWNESMNSLTDVMGERQFGCANEKNFAAMVAEPRDVYENQMLAEGNGALLGTRVGDYQKGNQRAMIVTSATVGGGSTSIDPAKTTPTTGTAASQ